MRKYVFNILLDRNQGACGVSTFLNYISPCFIRWEMYSGASLVWVNDLRFFPEALRWSRGLFCLSRFIGDGQLFLIMFATLETGDWQCILRGIPRTWEVAA